MGRYAFLRQPRWLALGFLVLLVLPSFILLSRWQLSRLDDRRYFNDLVTTHSAAAPVPVDSVMRAGDPLDAVGDDQRWFPVTATGRYDAGSTVLVRKRPLEGKNGFWVVTPLVTSSGSVLVVNRGWIAADGSASAAQAVPAPPTGEITLTGRLQPSEAAPDVQPGDLPAGQITDLSVPLVAGGASAYPGYVTLVESSPADSADLRPIPLPDLSDGPHLSYAVQWVFFAGVAVVGFVLLIRRESEYAAAEAALATDGTPTGPPQPTGSID
ncbi:SURF1 family cytochrome oxidase biogenesis protein [Longivirga aurantiaca]|uniref:SURF1-like protein n=1 Tax=Longivirga aurantiaca TaxID=1837743 RepID=A0ABW1T348_9ACTN